MKRKSRILPGPGAASLILILVILSLSILGILSLMTAENELRLSERTSRVAEAVSLLYTAAQETFAELDACARECPLSKNGEGGSREEAGTEAFLKRLEKRLPDKVSRDGDLLVWSETDESRTLDCAVRVSAPGSMPRLVWVKHRLASDTGGFTEDLWN